MDFVPNILDRLTSSGKSFADLVFLVVTIYVAAMSTILFFHWKKYARGGKFLVVIELIYLSVSIIFLATAFFSLN